MGASQQQSTKDMRGQLRERRDQLRTFARERRAILSAAERRSKSAAVCEVLSGLLVERRKSEEVSQTTVAVYAAFPEELSLDPFITFAYDQGFSVAFPCMVRDAHASVSTLQQTMEMRAVPRQAYSTLAAPFLQNPLRWFYHNDAELQEFPYVAASELAFLVVPVVGFDAQGNRLGYGKGNYDRYLAQVFGDTCVRGVAFVEQQVDAIPAEAHDIPLEIIAR